MVWQKKRVLIVAKTRRGVSACIGGITRDGESVRLEHVSGPLAKEHLDFNIGEVWEIECTPKLERILPHTETVNYRKREFVEIETPFDPLLFIQHHMPPIEGGVDKLYDGLVNIGANGAMFISRASGVPNLSTLFWRADSP